MSDVPLELFVGAAGLELTRDETAFFRDANPYGLFVFRRNTEIFPRSANAFDSYGEALARAEKKDDAIAAYRKALQLDPRQFSARDALVRLGATP